MSIELDPDSDYYGETLNRNSDGRVILAFGDVVAKKGDRVCYLDENGHAWEREEARKHFKAGDLLTVDRIRVGRDYSKYYFVGIPSDWNTVMFSRPILEQAAEADELPAAAKQRSTP